MHTYTGVPASTGIVVGPVEQIDHGTTGLHRIVCDPFRERALYDVAVVLAKDELRRLSQRAKGPDADILLFQIALLEDESFTNEIGDYIAAGAGGAAAVERAEQIFAGRLKNVDDEYIRERSVDVCDVCRRVVDILDGRPRRRLHLKRPSILVADRFFPSDLFSLDRRMVLGLASDQDSTVSHAAIMARSMGIPAVVQLGGGTAAMAVGHRAILDADNGTLIVEPDGAQIAQADCKIALSRLHGQKPDPLAALPTFLRLAALAKSRGLKVGCVFQAHVPQIEAGIEILGRGVGGQVHGQGRCGQDRVQAGLAIKSDLDRGQFGAGADGPAGRAGRDLGFSAQAGRGGEVQSRHVLHRKFPRRAAVSRSRSAWPPPCWPARSARKRRRPGRLRTSWRPSLPRPPARSAASSSCPPSGTKTPCASA